METTMKATVLAKKLRTRIAQLKSERAKKLASFDKDFESWKGSVAKWVVANVPKNVKAITKSSLAESRRGYNQCCSGLPREVFKNIPQAPRRPDDEPIRAMQRKLRFIALTGQESIRVSERDLDEWFGKEETESEEDDS